MASMKSMPPQACRFPFDDFAAMVKSDVKCVFKVLKRRNVVDHDASGANKIPIMYMDPKAYSAEELKKIVSI